MESKGTTIIAALAVAAIGVGIVMATRKPPPEPKISGEPSILWERRVSK